MPPIAFAFFFVVACSGHVQSIDESNDDPSATLSTLLSALRPAAAFNPSGMVSSWQRTPALTHHVRAPRPVLQALAPLQNALDLWSGQVETLSEDPSAGQFTEGNVMSMYQGLKTLSLSDAQITDAMLKRPAILAMNFQQVMTELNSLKSELELSDEEVGRMVFRQPELIGYPFFQMKALMEAFRTKLAFTDANLNRMVQVQPAVLGLNFDQDIGPLLASIEATSRRAVEDYDEGLTDADRQLLRDTSFDPLPSDETKDPYYGYPFPEEGKKPEFSTETLNMMRERASVSHEDKLTEAIADQLQMAIETPLKRRCFDAMRNRMRFQVELRKQTASEISLTDNILAEFEIQKASIIYRDLKPWEEDKEKVAFFQKFPPRLKYFDSVNFWGKAPRRPTPIPEMPYDGFKDGGVAVDAVGAQY